ncbi:FAD-binding oxidoreductase [Aliihoeflea sp. 40Bstr573]|uniref:NAD(P)/FAD-dependent oxidoreductase n=1 Tax=Aliihoeflea sp. 40Bstr573 TaxID=2696467 RepID=UPI0020959503|nr:FAD-binding oxidoreductase [Aliihoeflea sp. 40Bstr573]MCO6386547.1 FAD-dependent oxidoreductase [Aliihoeflea sp. 40Bstr573]
MRKLDLRTGKPVWHAYRAPSVPVAALTRDITTEILVVGMGISGAMMAEALTGAGHEVVLIDRRGPLLGSTPATTALVQYEIDTPLYRLKLMIGRADAERAWRRSRLAVMNLKSHVEALGIACDLSAKPTLYLAGNELAGRALEAEAEARRDAGILSRYMTAKPLKEEFGLERDGAILSHDNLALDPRKLTAGLLNLARSRGARLYANVEATTFVHGKDGVSVETASGPVITAGHVVLCTGYELVSFVPADNHQVISTWALATKPQKQNLWPQEAFIWEASDPYLYMRATKDGRVICGGEDEEFQDEERRDALLPERIAAIRAKLKKLLPGLDTEPQFAWAGAFGSTSTGLPIIGAVPRKPRIHAIMGYGGNGITFSRIASEIISAAIAGRSDSDADLFAFKT